MKFHLLGPFAALPLLFLSTIVFSPRVAGASPVADAGAVIAQQSGGPVASFSVNMAPLPPGQQNPRVHDILTFDAGTSQGNNLSYAWNFGDGSPSASGRQVTHSYNRVDDYTVTLSLVDGAGQTATGNQTVRIAPFVDSLVGQPPLGQVVPAGVTPATLNIQAPGPGDISASLSGDLLTSKPVPFSTLDDLEYVVLSGVVADETDPTIDQQIIQQPGGSVPLQNNVELDLHYQTSAGKDVDVTDTVSLQKDRDPSKGVWSITYPNFSLITGTTDPSEPDTSGYYLKGDAGFHHPDDPLVRKYAIEAARAGGNFPSDPSQVMDNIYAYVGGLFASDDPAQIDPDNVIAQKIASGELVPGQRLEKYICISQTYFLSSLSRTLGLPSRELTIGLGAPVSQNSAGAWTLQYYQEGATQVWFASSWHLYDTWLHIRNLDDYLNQKYAYIAWYSSSPHTFELRAKNGDGLGIYGHDFSIGEENGATGSPDEWNWLQQKQRTGLVIANFQNFGS